MPYKLVDKLADLKPYEPSCGEYKIRLDANESYIDANVEMREKIIQAVSKVALNRYPDARCEKLCCAFADLYNLDPLTVTAGNGSDELISVIIGSFLEKGSRLLSIVPDFSMYRFYADIYEVTNITLNLSEDLQIDIDEVISKAKENVAEAVIFSNPCNPTSQIVKKRDIVKLVESVESLVIVDEAYMEFAGDESVLGLAQKYDNLIVLKTCSKAFGLAALRLGFAVSNKTITNALKAAKSPYNVNSVSQAIGEVILKEKQYLKACIAQIIAQRGVLQCELNKLTKQKSEIVKIFESNTNFVFIEMKDSAKTFEALKARSILVRQMGKYLRITAGSENETKAVISDLEEILT